MGKFQPGHPKLGGRKKGTPHKKTVEKTLLTRAAAWLDGDAYWQNVQNRITRGRAPHAESYLLQRIHGKPTETVELSGPNRKPLKVIIEVIRG